MHGTRLVPRSNIPESIPALEEYKRTVEGVDVDDLVPVSAPLPPPLAFHNHVCSVLSKLDWFYMTSTTMAIKNQDAGLYKLHCWMGEDEEEFLA